VPTTGAWAAKKQAKKPGGGKPGESAAALATMAWHASRQKKEAATQGGGWGAMDDEGAPAMSQACVGVARAVAPSLLVGSQGGGGAVFKRPGKFGNKGSEKKKQFRKKNTDEGE